MCINFATELKKTLDRVHLEYVKNHEVVNDAIAPVLAFKTKRDKELVAFLSATFAYGRVDQIKKSVSKIVKPMGRNPYKWLVNTSPSKIYRTYLGWKHRFNDSQDLYDLLILLRHVYKTSGSMEKYFKPKKTDTAFKLLNRIVDGFVNLNLKVTPPLVKKKIVFLSIAKTFK